jgi:uncharacterized protein (UPF0335 family)
MAETNVAQDQIKAYVDRILRMKEEAKAINADIREIYAEAKGNGFDKTVLGKLVGYVEKRQTDAATLAEHDALFDLYLTAFDGASGKVGTKRATHTHASEDRSTRSKARLSEAMDDNKALSAEMLAEGLISEEAHAENIALSDAVATKLGAGVVEITHPQPTKAAESDLTDPKPLGQVATHSQAKASEDGGANVTGESAPDDSVTGDVSRASVDAGIDAPIPDADKSVEAPASAALPGEVYWENTPREPVKQHEYSKAFGTLGQDIHVITEDIAKAQSQAIVMMGDTILDGWARYNVARGMVGIDGQTTEYPAYQYDGTDPLVDCIRLNVAGRILNDSQRQIIAKRLIALEPKRKADIIKAFGFIAEVAA